MFNYVYFITLLPPPRSPPSLTPSSYLPPPIIPPHTPHLYPPSTSTSPPSLLLRSYQVRGHLAAQIDPLGLNNMEREKAKKMIIRSVTVDQKVGWLELILEYQPNLINCLSFSVVFLESFPSPSFSDPSLTPIT